MIFGVNIRSEDGGIVLNDLMSRDKTFSITRQGINFSTHHTKKLLNTNTQDNVGIGKVNEDYYLQ